MPSLALIIKKKKKKGNTEDSICHSLVLLFTPNSFGELGAICTGCSQNNSVTVIPIIICVSPFSSLLQTLECYPRKFFLSTNAISYKVFSSSPNQKIFSFPHLNFSGFLCSPSTLYWLFYLTLIMCKCCLSFLSDILSQVVVILKKYLANE